MEKKPDATPESILRDQLALCTQAVRECFEGVRAARRDHDKYGYARGAELNGAVAILDASAKVGAALARIKGEFRQNISVQRKEGGAGGHGSNGQDRDG
jgi:hypothetical protein